MLPTATLSASLAVLALVLARAPLAAAAEKPAAASSEAKALAATIAAVDIPYERFQLGNGLTVLVHTDRKAPIVGVTTYYRVGSKNEPKGKTGFAHLVGHRMFGGRENVPNFDEPRWEESRVGEGWGSRGRYRWAPCQ